MPAVRLTESAIAAATKRAGTDAVRIELADAGCPGLRIRITPTGARTWVLGCRDSNGAARRFKVGQFPEMGVAEARAAARTLRVEVARGDDPIAKAKAQRRQAQDARLGIGTLTAILDRYAAQHGKNLRSWAEARRRIESVFADHLERPAAAVRRADLQLTADAWESQSSASAAVRYLRPVLKWAASRDLVTADAANLKPPAAVKRRDRFLSRPELARLLPALRRAEGAYAAAMHYMLLTACRREEACSAEWRDIDFQKGVWTIRRTKNSQPHEVPLSRQATALLNRLGPGKPSEFVFASTTGKPLGNWDRAGKAILAAANAVECDEPEIHHFTRHDLRRTAATLMGELGELPDIIEAALNHVSIRSTLAATYNRSRYRPQVAVALQRLADCLDGIETGGAEVVPLRRA